MIYKITVNERNMVLSMYNLIDFVCMITGAYLIHTAVVMKKRGEIVANVVLNKTTSENAIKDKEGFINYLYIRLLLIGIVIILSGIVDIVNLNMNGAPIIGVIAFLVFAAALAAYGVVTHMALKKFT